MRKTHREAQIDELKGKLNAYAGGPAGLGVIQSSEFDGLYISPDDDSEEREGD